MTPEDRRMYNLLETRLAQIERERRQYWAVPLVGGTSAPSYLWICQGGNIIPTLGRTGISRRTPDSVISPSELPDGAPGIGIIIVPAYPIPVGLPNGIGVIQNIQGTYAFCRIDQGFGGAFGAQDIAAGEGVFITGTMTNIDKVSGAATYRYTCYSPVYGYY